MADDTDLPPSVNEAINQLVIAWARRSDTDPSGQDRLMAANALKRAVAEHAAAAVAAERARCRVPRDDNSIDNLLDELDDKANAVDHYEFGLPLDEENRDVLRDIVRSWLADPTLASPPADAPQLADLIDAYAERTRGIGGHDRYHALRRAAALVCIEGREGLAADAQAEARDALKVGDRVAPARDYFRSGGEAYSCAVVACADPLVLVSEGADMRWRSTVDGYQPLRIVGRASAEALKRCQSRLSQDELAAMQSEQDTGGQR